MSTETASKKRRRLEDLVQKARPTSYGVLLYRVNDDANDRHDKPSEIRFLLGLIPQRNFWTVFKGTPDSPKETPQETALREFQEETGTEGILKEISNDKDTTMVLRGRTLTKELVIFLQEGSHVSTSCFRKDRVVKIDQGYMKGHPEIVAIRWLTFQQAMEGVVPIDHDKNNKTARIYKSQENILKEAHEFIQSNVLASKPVVAASQEWKEEINDEEEATNS